MIELSNLKLLAQGGQAKIYELDGDRILRVLRGNYDAENLRCEMSVMNSLHASGRTVPKVYEYLEIDDKPSIIMERLKGVSMMAQMKRKPSKIFQYAKKLAKLHMEVTGPAEGLGLMSIHKRAEYLIPMAELLSDELKQFALGILSELPEGNDICHGDFHPGNIIIDDNKYYVIDWYGVASGRKLCDIAHTYLLYKNTPKLDSAGKIDNLITGIVGPMLSHSYIKTCHKLYPFDWAEFSKWMVVRASERAFYGMPNEKPALVNFLNKCMKASKAGILPKHWWKYI